MILKPHLVGFCLSSWLVAISGEPWFCHLVSDSLAVSVARAVVNGGSVSIGIIDTKVDMLTMAGGRDLPPDLQGQVS